MFRQTDKCVGLALSLTVVVWIVNILLSSVYLLYFNLLAMVAIFAYTIWKVDPLKELKKAWFVGMVACLVYSYIDSFLSNLRFGMVTHLETNDWLPFGATPLALILMWGMFITLVLYLYQRICSFGYSNYIPLLMTAGIVLVGSFVFEWLGNMAHLWNWNAELIQGGYLFSVPIFVPITYAVTSIFAPYILKNPFIGGLRCGVALGMVRFGGFALIRYLATGV